MSNGTKYLVISPKWGSTPRLTDWLTVSRNVTLTLTNQNENENVNGASSRQSKKKGSAEDWLWVIAIDCD
jgi:ABC-type nitrate/sulfonate/bicarbonate transport system ATPase subunit